MLHVGQLNFTKFLHDYLNNISTSNSRLRKKINKSEIVQKYREPVIYVFLQNVTKHKSSSIFEQVLNCEIDLELVILWISTEVDCVTVAISVTAAVPCVPHQRLQSGENTSCLILDSPRETANEDFFCPPTFSLLRC